MLITALVQSPVLPLMQFPGNQSELADEVLHGMTVELNGRLENGWVRVRTFYQYEGYAPLEGLLMDERSIRQWETAAKLTVRAAIADVLSGPAYRCWRVESLPRGALVAALGTSDENGWMQIGLCDGREGYVKKSFLGEYYPKRADVEETTLRARLLQAAESYLGTPYRWGGKTPQGIDCSGLCSMAYLLNGIHIYRDADILEGLAMRRIAPESVRQGDLYFFTGHVAMAAGGGKIIHSTARNGSDGVVINSLRPDDNDFRADLPPLLRFAGTIF